MSLMTPEARGRRAQEILDDEVFREALAMADDLITEAWRKETSAANRESLWHQIQGGSPLTRALRTIAGRGTFAAHERQLEEGRSG